MPDPRMDLPGDGNVTAAAADCDSLAEDVDLTIDWGPHPVDTETALATAETALRQAHEHRHLLERWTRIGHQRWSTRWSPRRPGTETPG